MNSTDNPSSDPDWVAPLEPEPVVSETDDGASRPSRAGEAASTAERGWWRVSSRRCSSAAARSSPSTTAPVHRVPPAPMRPPPAASLEWRLGGGSVAGEQHIQGTVTATTATTLTVKSSSATTTYTVNATTEIIRNGKSAMLAGIKVGDPVMVHVFPSSSGTMLVERLMAGTSASDGGGFGPPRAGHEMRPSGATGTTSIGTT